jgi:C-methyltransferase C-terminal domain/Putative zinc binding domain/Methyltransferase domain
LIKRSCRSCGAQLEITFVDLGVTPLANAFVTAEALGRPEIFYPLHAYVCSECFLVQLEEFESPQNIFSEYAYFSSFSETWLQHAQTYAREMIKRFHLGPKSQVIEAASNDGYLLQFFHQENIPVLGIEPAANIAGAAIGRGIPTIVKFFGEETAKELVQQGHQADLLVANNVLAHVPNLDDFIQGLRVILKSEGVITLEFPHLLNMMEECQFDTIYHEHFSYFSFLTINRIFNSRRIRIFDVEQIPTHGGSLRVYACHSDSLENPVSNRCGLLLDRERARGLDSLNTYRSFEQRVRQAKREFLRFLIEAKTERKIIAGYGAPAKGNTLLVYCGVRTDFVEFTVDKSPHKQGLYLPGTLIPIKDPQELRRARPDYVVILPWNLKDEIMEQIAFIRGWGGKFVVPIPSVAIYD